MSGSIDYGKCPKCQYIMAVALVDLKRLIIHNNCPRCGYYYESTEEGQAEGGGNGSYFIADKDEPGYVSGSTGADTVAELKDWLKAENGKCRICARTYEENDKWYIEDLLTGKIQLFSESEFDYEREERLL